MKTTNVETCYALLKLRAGREQQQESALRENKTVYLVPSSLEQLLSKLKIFSIFFRAKMCTIIVTIRTVLWAVMTIAGSLMILVSLFTNRWLIGGFQVPSDAESAGSLLTSGFDKVTDAFNGRGFDDKIAIGIFLNCVKPEGNLVRAKSSVIGIYFQNGPPRYSRASVSPA